MVVIFAKLPYGPDEVEAIDAAVSRSLNVRFLLHCEMQVLAEVLRRALYVETEGVSGSVHFQERNEYPVSEGEFRDKLEVVGATLVISLFDSEPGTDGLDGIRSSPLMLDLLKAGLDVDVFRMDGY